MIDWYIEIAENSPEAFKSDKYLSRVIDTASPCIDYFCKRLTELKDWKLEDANNIFKDIIDELPIMTSHVYENEFHIRYNQWVEIKLTETPKQIYRDTKINFLLS